MTALRFPKADGQMIVVTEQVHASQTYTRQVRISVRHIIMYRPASSSDPDGDTTMQIEGRSQPVRLLHSAEEIDALVYRAPQGTTECPAPFDLAFDGPVPT